MAAAACVGIIIGIVTLTGIGTRLPATIIPLAEQSLLLALVLIMISSIVLGMGLPSAVCYLLMATLIGPVLGNLGVIPLAAHLFIFYFGMMSMVTPPVALAAYAAASIAGTSIMPTAFAAFRFAIVGFTLPYMFVYRPELLMLSADGSTAGWLEMLLPVAMATLGVVCFAAGIAGHLRHPLGLGLRLAIFGAAALLLAPGPTAVLAGMSLPILDVAGVILVGVVLLLNRRSIPESPLTLPEREPHGRGHRAVRAATPHQQDASAASGNARRLSAPTATPKMTNRNVPTLEEADAEVDGRDRIRQLGKTEGCHILRKAVAQQAEHIPRDL